MPNFEDHVKQATANIQFLESFIFARSNDWAITVMFYSALHITEALIWKKANLKRSQENNYDYDIHCPNHDKRARTVKELMPEIHFQYLQLEKAAHNSRYKVYRFRDNEVQSNSDNYFKPIITFFNAFSAQEKLSESISFSK